MNSFAQVVDFFEKNTSHWTTERTLQIQAENSTTLFLRIESETHIGDLTVWDAYGTFQQIVASFETGEVIFEGDALDWRNVPIDTVFAEFLSYFSGPI